jgi:hypothetical protein
MLTGSRRRKIFEPALNHRNTATIAKAYALGRRETDASKVPQPGAPDDPRQRPILLAISAAGLALALQCGNGHLEPAGFLLMTAGLVVCAKGVSSPRRLAGAPVGLTLEQVLGVALGLAVAAHFVRPPGIYLDVPWPIGCLPFLIGIAIAGVALVLVVRAAPSPTRFAVSLCLLLLLHALLGTWVIRHSSHPAIDVAIFQRDAVDAFMAGRNPFTLKFQDIYSPAESALFYGPGMSVGGRLQFGFVYPPLSLLLAIPGVVLGGDFRYSQLIAMSITGAFIGSTRRSPIGLAAAALYLFAPRAFFVLEQGWTEPFVVLLLAAIVFCACRLPACLGVALGLFFVSKQYVLLALPLVPLLSPTGRELRWGAFISGSVVALAVTLPFVLWDARAFVRDVVTLQFSQPFRSDALSLPAAIRYVTGWRLPTACAFLAAMVASWMALRGCPRGPSGFAAATGFVLFAFFAFNKQAFCNYYSLVVGSLCVAVGAWPSDTLAISNTSRF